jgi:general secretion pathway protein D
MIRRSVSDCERRLWAPLRVRCARFALAGVLCLIAALASSQVHAQVPALDDPAPVRDIPNAEDLPIPREPAPDPAPGVDDEPSVLVSPQATIAPPVSESVSSSEKPAPRESEDLAVALQKPGDLNLHGLTLNAALFTISEQWNINIVAGDVQGTVNGVFKQAPLREILDAILLSNGYNYRAVGKSLVVSKTSELGQTSPFFESATIPVRSADIDEVVEVARLLSTPQGQVRAMKSARSIVVLDFPDRVEMIRRFVASNDGGRGEFGNPAARMGAPLEVAYFRTQHITARTAEQALQAILSKDGRVGVLEKENRILVADYAENLAMIEKVLERIDRPRPQVRITALIYDISLEDIEQLGLDWNRLQFTDGDSTVGFASSSTPFGVASVDSLSTSRGNIAIGTLNTHFDIDAVCHALQEAKDARLLASPNVAVLDNEQATFRSVREIPIQQLTETQQGGNIGTTAFRDAGITLTVTPKIASDCTISMEVAPEFSRHVGNDEAGQPIIDTREASSVLRVANRQTIVIGGLRQRDDIGEFNGIPYLKDLKVVGRLFRSRSTTVRESELVVFIMPEIIDCADQPDYRETAAEQTIRCRLDNIPEAEGCPPRCRRLPPEMMDQPILEDESFEATEELPEQIDVNVPPQDLGAHNSNIAPAAATVQITSAEPQFGIAGRDQNVRNLVHDGRIRRLPATETAPPVDDTREGEVASGQATPIYH